MDRLIYLSMKFFALLPFSALYILSDCTYVLLYHVIQYRKKIVRVNLKSAFPELSFSERKKIEQEFYHHFCDVFFETLKALTISKKNIYKRFKIINPEILEEFYQEDKSIILYTAHLGNWEWLSFIPHYTRYKTSTFYQPLSNKYMDTFMHKIRSQFGTQCIPSNSGYKELLKLKLKNTPSLNCIIGDQSPKRNSLRYKTTFMNQETEFMVGGDRIAAKLNYAVLYPEIIKTKRGHYELTLKVIEGDPKIEDNNKMLQTYINLLEKNIMEDPALWLWSHKRWKNHQRYD